MLPKTNKKQGSLQARSRFPTFRHSAWLFFLLAAVVWPRPAGAHFIKWVEIASFENLDKREGPYDPASIVSQTLRKGMQSFDLRPHVSTASGNSRRVLRLVESHTQLPAAKPGGGKFQIRRPVQFIIQGEVLKFEPDLIAPIPDKGALPKPTGIAEIQVNIRVVHNLTHRVIAETRLWAVGQGGSIAFASTPESMIPGRPDFKKTSMGRALMQLTRRTHSYLKRVLYPQPLDAQVFMVDLEKGLLTINVGKKHGVRVQDEFRIYHVALAYKDPLTEADLGDKWTRMGVVRVQTVGDGFSRGVVMAGTDFFRGQIARALMPTPPALLNDDSAWQPPPVAKTSEAGIFPGAVGQARPRTPLIELGISPFFRFSLDY